jgi:hypothetical protein
MSFVIFFQPCRFSGKPVKQKNPFTGEEQSVVPIESLTLAEVKAVWAVLKKASPKGPDDFGYYVVKTDDGGEAEVSANNPHASCMASVRGLTPALVRVLFDLLEAGNWVMVPAMEPNIAITCSPENLKGIPGDFPKVLTCTSADELGALLSDGFKRWPKYRDQVTRGAGRRTRNGGSDRF